MEPRPEAGTWVSSLGPAPTKALVIWRDLPTKRSAGTYWLKHLLPTSQA